MVHIFEVNGIGQNADISIRPKNSTSANQDSNHDSNTNVAGSPHKKSSTSRNLVRLAQKCHNCSLIIVDRIFLSESMLGSQLCQNIR